jgi:hypothetical protein
MVNINCYPLIFKQKSVIYKNTQNKSKIKNTISIFGMSKSSIYNWCNLNNKKSLQF